MTWLDRLDDAQTRRRLSGVRRQAIGARRFAQEQVSGFAHDAGRFVDHAAHEFATHGRQEATDAARETARHYAQRAGEIAGHVADYGRHEGAVLAQAAAVQAIRAGRAVKADPVPMIVGAVGLALLANLLLGRRRRDR